MLTDRIESVMPSVSASLGSMAPLAVGRRRVRAICRSMSASNQLLMAAAAPAAAAMQRMAVNARIGCSGRPGAR